MASTPTHHGIILFAHGSRDPLWRLPMEAVADRARQLDPLAHVQCAYLELMEPDLPACAAAMAQAGVQSVTVVPMFLGVGRHARKDLPLLMDDLQAKHPHITFRLQPAIGEDPLVVELMAKIALGMG
jgi:sirohydrochlorin cobaltochelatase